jgi:hypothetical protein
MTLTDEERLAHQNDLSHLTDFEIRRRLEAHIWRGEKLKLAQQHLEDRELRRSERFGAKDRQLQERIFWVAVAGVLVGIASIIATLVTR